MLAYLLALASATFYGAADFLGGLAARRTHTSAVIVVSGAAGLMLLAGLLTVVPGRPSRLDLAWGAAAGLAGGVGLGLLYRALAIGRMAVVAPITAVCGVVVPALAGVLLGERLPSITWTGIGLALVAIVLVSHAREHEVLRRGQGPARRGVGIALLAGVAIGIFYLTLAETSPEAGLWPLLTARASSVTLFFALAVAARHSLRLEGAVLRTAVAAGVLDMTANALYIVATRGGPLSVVVTLVSLYPASTVVLARVVLHERLNIWQIAGVVCALIAVAMIVGG